MYERFSGQARKAMQLAHQEARRRRHDFLGTGHVLLGVLREGSEGIDRLLTASGIDRERTYRDAEALLPSGSEDVRWEKLPLTPAAKRALDYAQEEAWNLRHASVGPEHLLLGMLREPDSEAAQLLAPLGLTPHRLREELGRLPPPANRDNLVRPEPAPGLPAAPDPSPEDLEATLTRQPLPPAQEMDPAKWQKVSAVALRPGAWPHWGVAQDLQIVQQQLRTLQFLVAAIGGGLTGILLGGPMGALFGIAAGTALVSTRSHYLAALAGAVAGICCVYALGSTLLDFVAGWAGFAVGFCLGDWRKLRAPPGTGG